MKIRVHGRPGLKPSWIYGLVCLAELGIVKKPTEARGGERRGVPFHPSGQQRPTSSPVFTLQGGGRRRTGTSCLYPTVHSPCAALFSPPPEGLRLSLFLSPSHGSRVRHSRAPLPPRRSGEIFPRPALPRYSLPDLRHRSRAASFFVTGTVSFLPGCSQGRRGGVPERRRQGGGGARREAGGCCGRRPPEAPRDPHAAAQEARHPLQTCKALISLLVPLVVFTSKLLM